MVVLCYANGDWITSLCVTEDERQGMTGPPLNLRMIIIHSSVWLIRTRRPWLTHQRGISTDGDYKKCYFLIYNIAVI